MSATQLPIEAIAATVDKSDLALDLQTDIIFSGKGGAKINKFCIVLPASQVYRAQTLRQNNPKAALRSTKSWCVSTCFSWAFSRIWRNMNMNGGLARSESALISSNQCFDEWLQSFTQYARKNLICGREKAPPADKVQSVFWRIASVVHTIRP